MVKVSGIEKGQTLHIVYLDNESEVQILKASVTKVSVKGVGASIYLENDQKVVVQQEIIQHMFYIEKEAQAYAKQLGGKCSYETCRNVLDGGKCTCQK